MSGVSLARLICNISMEQLRRVPILVQEILDIIALRSISQRYFTEYGNMSTSCHVFTLLEPGGMTTHKIRIVTSLLRIGFAPLSSHEGLDVERETRW